MFQKQPPRFVLRKRCSENTQQIYKRTSIPKCDFNKVALHIEICVWHNQTPDEHYKTLYGTTRHLKLCKWLLSGHGLKVGPGPRDPGPPSKFKSETRDPLQNLKVGPPTKFKSGTPSPFFNEFIFFRIFFRFFYLFIFVSFLNKMQKNMNCE